jgi:predicted RNA-binding protein YlqC (UPF0109 family)
MGQDAVDILKDMLTAMVTALVDKEGEINILCSPKLDGPIVFTVDVAKEDVGKLIGRSGKMAGALRHVLGAASAKLQVRSTLIIPDKRGEQ